MPSMPTRKSRHRNKLRFPFWLLSLLIVLFIVGIGLGYLLKESSKDSQNAIKTSEEEKSSSLTENKYEEEKVATEKESFTEITIAAAGDIMVHHDQLESAFENGDGTYDFKPMFEDVRSILQSADLTIANFETTTAGPEQEYAGYPRFNSPDELIDAVLYAGVDVLTTANNHSLDTTDKGLIRTVQEIRKRGIETVGTYVDGTEERILIKEVEGIKFAILSYTESTNGLGDHYDPDYLHSILNIMTKENISRDIKAAKEAEVDFVITFMHWGEEYMTEPNEKQIDFAHFMAEEGVDLILGSHPHVIQKTDLIENSEGKETFVVYSMGNFISNQRKETLGEEYEITEDGIIIHFDIRKNNETGETMITDIEYIPTWVYRHMEEGRNTYHYRILPIENFLLKDEISEVYKQRMERSYESTISKMFDFPSKKK